MTNLEASKASKPPKRLYILDDEEIEALYARPLFTGDDRTHAFMLTQSEKDLLASFTQSYVQLYFILQLGYFKAKQLFFTFTFQDVADDVTHLLQRYFSDVQMYSRDRLGRDQNCVLSINGPSSNSGSVSWNYSSIGSARRQIANACSFALNRPLGSVANLSMSFERSFTI